MSTPTKDKLLALTANNGAFSKKTPGLQTNWDSTSSGLLKTCPRKYYYSIIEGWQPKRTADPLRFGLAFAKCMEEFEKIRAEGIEYEEALFKITRIALELTLELDEETGELKPWTTIHPNRSREALIRSVIWYCEEYKDDNHKTLQLSSGKPAVEITFSHFADYEVLGEPVIKCGHLDKITQCGDSIWVVDHKTTKGQLNPNFFGGFSPSNQMSFYSEAGAVVLGKPVDGVMIDGASISLKEATRFARGLVHRTPGLIAEWNRELRVTLEANALYVERACWPQNDTACSHYGGCPFKEICTTDPSTREIYLESNFKRRIWDPTNPRN